VLAVAAILGDLRAFDELLGRYRPAVVRTAQSVVGRQDAEDIAQEAMLLAFKALPSIEYPGRFAAWLMVITRNRARRFLRRLRRRRDQQVDLDALLIEHVAALSRPPPIEHAKEEGLERALANVPEDYALVLRLRFLDEMPLNRIAACLDVTLSTVKWRVFRGKALLREQLERLNQPSDGWNENKIETD
jgi:RNA polymerase sigma-70 factor (ECF subfamily)